MGFLTDKFNELKAKVESATSFADPLKFIATAEHEFKGVISAEFDKLEARVKALEADFGGETSPLYIALAARLHEIEVFLSASGVIPQTPNLTATVIASTAAPIDLTGSTISVTSSAAVIEPAPVNTTAN